MGNPEEVHSYIHHTQRKDGGFLDAPSLISFRFQNGKIGNLEVVYSPELEISGYYLRRMTVWNNRTDGIIWITEDMVASVKLSTSALLLIRLLNIGISMGGAEFYSINSPFSQCAKRWRRAHFDSQAGKTGIKICLGRRISPKRAIH